MAAFDPQAPVMDHPLARAKAFADKRRPCFKD
jgi:hypothetical protein